MIEDDHTSVPLVDMSAVPGDAIETGNKDADHGHLENYWRHVFVHCASVQSGKDLTVTNWSEAVDQDIKIDTKTFVTYIHHQKSYEVSYGHITKIS